MGDGRPEGLSATGGGGKAVISLMPDTDGMSVCIFESVQLESCMFKGPTIHICLLYFSTLFIFINGL